MYVGRSGADQVFLCGIEVKHGQGGSLASSSVTADGSEVLISISCPNCVMTLRLATHHRGFAAPRPVLSGEASLVNTAYASVVTAGSGSK